MRTTAPFCAEGISLVYLQTLDAQAWSLVCPMSTWGRELLCDGVSVAGKQNIQPEKQTLAEDINPEQVLIPFEIREAQKSTPRPPAQGRARTRHQNDQAVLATGLLPEQGGCSGGPETFTASGPPTVHHLGPEGTHHHGLCHLSRHILGK